MAQLQTITPCLWFDGQAEEAARFYIDVFPDSHLLEIGRWPADDLLPGVRAGSVLTVVFQLAGQEFIALNGGPQFSFDEAISLSIRCESQAEVDHYWQRLQEGGGSPSQCGWLKDRYGLSWQVVPTVLVDMLAGPDMAKAARVMRVMMGMGKLEIAPLLAAAAGG